MNEKIISKDSLRSLLMPVMLLGLLALGSCKKCDDPCNMDCHNYDPCCGQTAADARFKIYELLQVDPSSYNTGFKIEDAATDTILYWNFARFRADEEAEYYEWRVGTDPRVWNTREFSLRFASVPYYTPIEVSLKVYKKTDQSCFPDAADTAVFTRKLYTVPLDSTKALGTYQGYLESDPNTNRSFTYLSGYISGSREDTISGIIPNCWVDDESAGGILAVYGYRSFFFYTKDTHVGCCYGLSGYGMLTRSEDLIMQVSYYSYDDKDSCSWSIINDLTITDVFTGTKIR